MVTKINKKTGQLYKDKEQIKRVESSGTKLETFKPRTGEPNKIVGEKGKVSKDVYEEAAGRGHIARTSQELIDTGFKEGLTTEQKQTREETLPVAEETGVFEERPQRVELSPTKEEVDFYKGRNQYTELQKRQLAKVFTPEQLEEMGVNNPQLLNDLITNPETQRQVFLQEIQRRELDKSFTARQKLGATLEPYLGDLKVFDIDIGGYADQWLQMPVKDVDSILESISEIESSASSMTDAASQGEIGNPAQVLRDLDQKDQDLAMYEARIKRLIIASPELRANPEKVNVIEAQILNTRETIFEAKQRAAEGALITPSNEQLYSNLQNIRNG